MLISVAGISTPFKARSVSGSSGFTILEILVVVAVISIMASTILLNTSFKRPDTELKRHTNLIGKTLQLLLQEAILNDENYAVSLVPGGYLVLQYNGEEWVPSEDKFIKSLQAKYDYSDELVIDNRIVKIEKQEKADPHILLLSSGEMSNFEWSIADRENQLNSKLNGNLLGNITIEGPAESLP